MYSTIPINFSDGAIGGGKTPATPPRPLQSAYATVRDIACLNHGNWLHNVKEFRRISFSVML